MRGGTSAIIVLKVAPSQGLITCVDLINTLIHGEKQHHAI